MTDCISVGCNMGKYLVTEFLWPPIKRRIDYWWCFGDNIQGLRDEKRYLESQRQDIDHKTEEARLRAERPTTEVKNWSKDGTQELEKAATILQGCDDLKTWNIFSRYSQGKSAMKTAEEIKKLRTEGDKIRISEPAPPPAMGSIYHEPTTDFESRRRIEEEIMDSLNDNHVGMIAICGAGGVGKTTMVRRIEDRVRKENIFDEVVHVVVSQQLDKPKLQTDIAEFLGLKFSADILEARAHEIQRRLLDSKRKLIIFDDVWKSFKLEDIGVHCFTRCKIILTSRVKDACKRMDAQKIIPLEVLNKEEAWTLFKEKAGSYVEGSKLRSIAEDVAAECRGLPVAIVTVGGALKDQVIPVWKDFLSQLRFMPIDFPEVIEDVYKPLKLSYDFLETESLKSLFLLCCLFPEDYDIPIEHLTLYSIGLGMFERIGNIEEGRSRTHSLVEKLKSRFLLMNGSLEHHVKMHDVVRDVAIFIGSKEKHGFLRSLEVSSMETLSKDSPRNCNWMSIDISIVNAKLPIGLDFLNLYLLIILTSTGHKFPQVFGANGIYFKGMEELNVLSFSDINLQSLPPTLGFLKKLRTLHLHSCEVKDISLVGKLASLEILYIHKCNSIEELPADIGRLNRLKLLELQGCSNLERIVPGVISSLVGLEELKIINSFSKWEAKGNQSDERNASLSELESLLNLTSLEIDISDFNLVAEEICCSQQLVRYRINVGRHPYESFIGMEQERIITLSLWKDVTVGNWFRQLIKNTQSLRLNGDELNNFNLAEPESMRRLKFTACSTVKNLGNAIDCKFPVLVFMELIDLIEFEEIIDGTIQEGSNSFQKLESLYVEYLPKLAYLWKSPNQNVSLGNLISIKIWSCSNLRYLFSVATVRSLVQLQHLRIQNCDMIEQVFWNEIESNDADASIIEFPNMKRLVLDSLPNLAAFSRGVEIIDSPQLTELIIDDCPMLRFKIGKCPNLRTIGISDCGAIEELLSEEIKDEGNRRIIFPKMEKLEHSSLPNLASLSQGIEITGFPQLTEFQITSCPKLKTPKIGKCPNLRLMQILNCDTIEEISWDEIKYEGKRHIIFPELKILKLDTLPCFTTFHRDVESIKFPKLEDMEIGYLPRLSSLAPDYSEPTHDDHSLHFFCNQKVEIHGLKKLCIQDLQDTISKIWCRHIPINFFRNLVFLNIYNVNGIRNLISSSIAENLVNLKELYIGSCQKMTAIIEDEKEVFVKLFPNLETLKLERLYKLRRFCQWNHAFELPSLEVVEIVDCPGMEAFTLGSLSTPKLHWFRGLQVEMKDLNGCIHDYFMM